MARIRIGRFHGVYIEWIKELMLVDTTLRQICMIQPSIMKRGYICTYMNMNECSYSYLDVAAIVHFPDVHQLPPQTSRYLVGYSLVHQRPDRGFDDIHIVPGPCHSRREILYACALADLVYEMLASDAETCRRRC